MECRYKHLMSICFPTKENKIILCLEQDDIFPQLQVGVARGREKTADSIGEIGPGV